MGAHLITKENDCVRDCKKRAIDRESLNERSLFSDFQHPESRDSETTTITPHSQRSFYTTWVQDWWLFELASLALGTGATTAIVVILLHYQNKPAPQLNSVMGVKITLNTIIAILATVSRASVLLPVAECICQQKWAWFSGSARPVTELDVFDQGSRGAFGSVVLIWKVNVR
jgi:hypothetical protein